MLLNEYKAFNLHDLIQMGSLTQYIRRKGSVKSLLSLKNASLALWALFLKKLNVAGKEPPRRYTGKVAFYSITTHFFYKHLVYANIRLRFHDDLRSFSERAQCPVPNA